MIISRESVIISENYKQTSMTEDGADGVFVRLQAISIKMPSILIFVAFFFQFRSFAVLLYRNRKNDK